VGSKQERWRTSISRKKPEEKRLGKDAVIQREEGTHRVTQDGVRGKPLRPSTGGRGGERNTDGGLTEKRLHEPLLEEETAVERTKDRETAARARKKAA